MLSELPFLQMQENFVDRISDLILRANKKARLVWVGFFLVILLPVLLATSFSYLKTRENLTQLTLSRRNSIAYTAAQVLKGELDHLTGLGVSFATRVQFRKLISEGKWEEAVKILGSVPRDFPFIERVFLADPEGTLMADTPELPGVKGKNFSVRDWYQGVSREWKPYISEVYQRTAQPQYNVIAGAVPIKADDQTILGILVMQARLETLLEWSKTVEVGPSGFTYFVDQKGQIAAHPKFSAQGEIVDFSSLSVIQKVLGGERGIEVFFNPLEEEEQLIAYEPIPEYGWGVLVAENTLTAFAARESSLKTILLSSLLLILFSSILAYLTITTLYHLNQYRQEKKIFLESVGDGLLAIDRSWNITLFNKAAGLITGFSQEEVLGKPLREVVKLIREKDRTENITFIEETMLKGEVRQMEDHTVLITKDGREVPVGDTAAPLFDSEGRVAGAIIVFRDISEGREVEKIREEFASLATHQMRAPLTAIGGYSDMLLEGDAGKLNEEQRKYIQEIVHANQRMLNLVNALLNVSRIELGALAIEPQPTHLPDLAEEVLKQFLPQIKDKNLKLAKVFDKDLPSINADPALMKNVFQNLLSNAVKYTPEGGEITINITSKPPDVLIKVSDTGLGIPKEEQSKIFSRMFRASNVVEKDKEGTGLGLYIVKQIMEQGGGKVWFESEEGKGTTFYVSLPLSGMKRKAGTKGLS